MNSRRILAGLVLIVLVAGFVWQASKGPMDFRVYYYGAAGVFDGTRPVYGQLSGMGYPMHYRYPPLFMLMTYPLTLLPLEWASALWTLFKCAALIAMVALLWRRLGHTQTRFAWVVPLLLASPYVVEDLRYGQAQSLVFALAGLALLCLPALPILGAAALSMAIIIKVWPLYLLPFLWIRREWRMIQWTTLFTILLALAPALYFGFEQNLSLLRQWTVQEFATQTGASEIWFPSQSLRGVMMRYLTVIDYSKVPDSNYPLIHVAALNPELVRVFWVIAAGGIYSGLLVVASRARQDEEMKLGLVYALAFASVTLLEPFSQKYTLVVLLWPAMVAASVRSTRYRALLYIATAIAIVQPLVFGSAAQRLLQVLGFDFLVAAFLTVFFAAAIAFPARPRML